MEKEINIYLLRGLSRESEHWGDFGVFLNANFPKSSIHYIDMPGAGIYHQSKSPTNIPSIVETLRSKELVQTTNNLLIASSLGGMVALEWISKYPNDFQFATTICSSYKGICNPLERFNLKFTFPVLTFLLSSNVRRREKIILRINSNHEAIRQDLIEKWVDIQHKRKLTKLNFMRQVLAGLRYAPVNPSISIPLLIIGSKKDELVKPNCIVKTHEQFGGTLKWHETAGHCVPIDEPKWLSDTIYEWLKTIDV